MTSTYLLLIREQSRISSSLSSSLIAQVTELGAYRMLVEQAHDLISAHTSDDRALFLFASGAFNRLLGIEPQVQAICLEFFSGIEDYSFSAIFRVFIWALPPPQVQ